MVEFGKFRTREVLNGEWLREEKDSEGRTILYIPNFQEKSKLKKSIIVGIYRPIYLTAHTIYLS